MNFELADSHCHLYFDDFDQDIEEVISNAQNKGITRIMVPGIDLKSSQQAISLSEKFENVFAAVGVHPNDTQSFNHDMITALEKLCDHKKVRAVGEIGLDYYRDRSPKEKQFESLKAQLLLAEKVNLPIIIHCRESFTDLWPIILDWHDRLCKKNHPLAALPGVFHSFSQDIDAFREIRDHNFFISLGGPVTFKNAKKLHSLVKELDICRLLLETDSPFLTPHPHRGTRNEPKYIALIAEKIAEFQKMPLKAIADQTSKNADQMFKWRSN